MKSLHKKFGYLPRVAVWELTLQCNLNCRHCGSRAGKPRPDELTLVEARRLCRELAELKCEFITLSGGEPLLRKDWPLIAETLVDLGITTGMISNGRTWSAEIAQTARAIGLESVAFSVDGFEEAHDYQRRLKGHWRLALAAIDSAVGHGLNTSVVTTVNSRNLAELEALRELLCAHGVTRWQVQFATRTGNMADNASLMLEPKDMLTAVPLLAKMCEDQRLPKVYPGHDVGYYGEPEEQLRKQNGVIPFWTGCSAGCSVIGIESNGNIKGCLSLPSELNGVEAFVEGNLRKASLKEIWYREGAFAYNREFTLELLSGFCRSCDYADICRGGCTWTCYAEKGFTRDNPYCYHRQLTEQGGLDGSKVHLPLVSESLEVRAGSGQEASDAEPESITSLKAERLLSEARRLAAQGQFADAESLLRELMAMAPNHRLALDLLGFALYSQGRPDEAEAVCRRTLELFPEHAYAHKGLGLCLARQGSIALAICSIERAIELEPGYFDAHWDLCSLLLEAGCQKEAEQALARARIRTSGHERDWKQIQASLQDSRSRS